MAVSTNRDLPSKYTMKSLPEKLKFDTANLKFASHVISHVIRYFKKFREENIFLIQQTRYQIQDQSVQQKNLCGLFDLPDF